jgi:hypothetical protein
LLLLSEVIKPSEGQAVTNAPDKPIPEDQPIYWFYLLEIAHERGDKVRADEAKRQLARLGVTVTFTRRPGLGDTGGGPPRVA